MLFIIYQISKVLLLLYFCLGIAVGAFLFLEYLLDDGASLSVSNFMLKSISSSIPGAKAPVGLGKLPTQANMLFISVGTFDGQHCQGGFVFIPGNDFHAIALGILLRLVFEIEARLGGERFAHRRVPTSIIAHATGLPRSNDSGICWQTSHLNSSIRCTGASESAPGMMRSGLRQAMRCRDEAVGWSVVVWVKRLRAQGGMHSSDVSQNRRELPWLETLDRNIQPRPG